MVFRGAYEQLLPEFEKTSTVKITTTMDNYQKFDIMVTGQVKNCQIHLEEKCLLQAFLFQGGERAEFSSARFYY
jgi:3-deoxy-D-arabino-heptulosonate 7-phosphate (DAHP) synthase class II